MRREIESLNEMSFELPQGWNVSKDKYNIVNGQGFINTENYISPDGEVLSLFEVQRDPDEFFEHFHNLVQNYNEKQDGIVLAKQFNLSVNDFSFPVYILKATKMDIFIVHIFINCGDALGCFMFNIKNLYEKQKDTVAKDRLFSQVAKILRTVE